MSDRLTERAEELYESIGGDLCICQRVDVPHWCEKCQHRISMIRNALQPKPCAGCAALREALSNLLENPDYQIAIGGNPHAVDAMLKRARAALAPSSPDGVES